MFDLSIIELASIEGLRKAENYVIVRRRSHCIPEEARALAWQLSSGGS
jgi:hypothetical protein